MKYAYLKEAKAIKFFWFYRSLLPHAEWLAHLDVDEYLTFRGGFQTVDKLLFEYEKRKADILYLSWITFSTERHSVSAKSAHVVERFPTPCKIQNGKFDRIKMILRTSSVFACCVETHRVRFPKFSQQGKWISSKKASKVTQRVTLPKETMTLAHYVSLARPRPSYCKYWNTANTKTEDKEWRPPSAWSNFLNSTLQERLSQGTFVPTSLIMKDLQLCSRGRRGEDEMSHMERIMIRDAGEVGLIGSSGIMTNYSRTFFDIMAACCSFGVLFTYFGCRRCKRSSFTSKTISGFWGKKRRTDKRIPHRLSHNLQ
jgi:hypothetical protein